MENKLINYCLQNSYTIYDFTKEYTIKGWHVTTKDNYLELAIASDAASIELNSPSSSLLAQFSLFIWTKYPTAVGIHLVLGDLSKSYLLQRNSSYEQIKAFLA
ncbi:hypothetical protein FNT36_14935 [Hymenobacter setariae]|uniref:Uncharacterized protein n=1 Tax=Hymenobacter setariae TaxID=2594794 RepID=A0A558BR54_9BACT|nr:hypothetical protein [Hymenobacter setariae]TVT38965.1 hypothetical protein FNT36_14935 [Hymenobacter setariae]